MINITIKEYPSIDEKVYTETLPNGLTVYVIPKHGFHKMFATYAANYGSSAGKHLNGNDWIDTPKGVAHFLEHLLFETTEGNALTTLTTNGASVNAYTSTDITAYYFKSIDRFSENLEILLDFVSVGHFTKESVEKEYGIIKQEILESEDDPYHVLYYDLMKSMFKHSAYRDPVAGTVESISQITADTLIDCHNVFYHPSNMVLCVAGDVDPEQIVSMAQNILPKTPGKALQLFKEEPEELAPVRKHTTKSMDISLPIFAIGCKSPPPTLGSDHLRFNLIGALALNLLAGRSSSLYFNLYNEGLVSSDFSVSLDILSSDTAYSLFEGETREPERVFDEIKKEITKLSKIGVEPTFFARTKKAALGSYLRSRNSFESICGSVIDGHFRGYDAFTTLDILSAISIDDITAFYKESLIPDNMAMSVITPK